MSELQKNETGNREIAKVKELASEVKGAKDKPSVAEADSRTEKRFSVSRNFDERLNRHKDVSFGVVAGCEAYCRKVRDGTRVHGTYH